MTLEQDILKKISPSDVEREAIGSKVKALLERVTAETQMEGMGLEVLLVGSVAKDTFLHDPDLDVFILFPESVARDRLEATGLALGRKVLGEGEERYAEHPYIHGRWEGLEVDLVPCYHIEDTSRLRSAVDRTPFHTQYVRSHLQAAQKDEVRLLKQFAKGTGIYGAEAKTQGFSGYLLELLILKYGTFQKVLEAASSWKRGTVLDLGGGRGRKFGDPLVFHDPVDSNRNVASALSSQGLATFIYAARQYLQAPSERFFFPRPREMLDLAEMKDLVARRGTGVLVVTMHRPRLIDDNLYPQVRRSLDGICALLESNDFKVIDRVFHVTGEIQFVVELEGLSLPLGRYHSGPPAWVDNSYAFLERWEKEGLSRPFLENGHWAVVAPRTHTQADDLVRSKLSTAALGSDLREAEVRGVAMGLSAMVEKNRPALSAMLDKRMNWEV
ncbi:MAG: CCA tRNA nucleotidyltransferase [Methanomassiliicoccus sp.]|nr:CCA tRNA nucleotidyltransferase [Methanomassiliicoccus sp.]